MSGLSRMMTFAEVFPGQEIIATLSQQLSWSHFVELLGFKDAVQCESMRRFVGLSAGVSESCAIKCKACFNERTAISRKPEDLVRQGDVNV